MPSEGQKSDGSKACPKSPSPASGFKGIKALPCFESLLFKQPKKGEGGQAGGRAVWKSREVLCGVRSPVGFQAQFVLIASFLGLQPVLTDNVVYCTFFHFLS